MGSQIPDLAQEFRAPREPGQGRWETRELKFVGVDHSFCVVRSNQLRDRNSEHFGQTRQDFQRRVTAAPFEV
jgi:hypothetical protein